MKARYYFEPKNRDNWNKPDTVYYQDAEIDELDLTKDYPKHPLLNLVAENYRRFGIRLMFLVIAQEEADFTLQTLDYDDRLRARNLMIEPMPKEWGVGY